MPVTNFVPFQYVPPKKTEASYVRCGRDGRVFAVIEGRSQPSLCVVGQRTEAINRAEAAFQALLAGAFSGDLTSVATAGEAVGA